MLTEQDAIDVGEVTRIYCAMKRAQATATRMEAEFEFVIAGLGGDALEAFRKTERLLQSVKNWEER